MRSAGLAPLDKASACPTLLIGGPEMRLNAHLVKLPHAVLPYIAVVVGRCPQHGLIPIGVGTGLQEVPGAGRRITSNLDDGAENVVDGKRDALARTAEELANSLSPFAAAEHPPIPDGIGREQLRQRLGIIVAITIGGVPRFQLFNLLQILQPAYAAL